MVVREVRWNIMGKVNVLVVEDEADIQQLVSYILIRAGFHVTCADSGEEALERLRAEEIDCVLLDLMLPGMSGTDVCTAMRKAEAHAGRPIPSTNSIFRKPRLTLKLAPISYVQR
jgi:two-component system alkaline phosphatase synthesis response regulator PhoP